MEKPNYKKGPCEESLLDMGLGISYDTANMSSQWYKVMACKQGFVKFGSYNNYENQNYSSQTMLYLLKKYPLVTSMVIPGCNEGSMGLKVGNRGGVGGVCDRDGMCRGDI
jgi:hypothetical protein